MRLRKQYLTKNDCYKTNRTIQVKGVMVHSTAADNPRVSRYVPTMRRWASTQVTTTGTAPV